MKFKVSWFFLLIASLFLFRLVLAFNFWHPDVANHMDWGTRFWQYGPSKFYEANVWNFTWPNQPPGTMYLMAGVRKVFEFVFGAFWQINVAIPAFPSGIITYFESNLYPALLHLPGILSDFGIAYIIYLAFKNLLDKEKLGKTAAIIFLLNPFIWYNSSMWGQYDSVINFFAILSFYLLLKRKLFWAVLAFGLSIYTKVSLLILAPIFFVILSRQNYKLFEVIKIFVFWTVVFGLLTLPFSHGEPYRFLYYLYKDKVLTNQLQVVSANAFNLWGAVFGVRDSAVMLSHNVLFGPLSYKAWGLILYLLSYIPAVRLVYKKQDVESVFWSLTIVAVSSFMLLTNMHERYLYPLFPYFTLILVMKPNLKLAYWTLSILGLLNMYNFWFYPKADWLITFMSMNENFIPRMAAFISFGVFIFIYVSFLRHLRSQKI